MAPPMHIIVAIDGPAGAGKSTVARRLASAIDATYIDTGAIYRAVAWAASRRGFTSTDVSAVESLIDSLRIELMPNSETSDNGASLVRVNGTPLGEELRSPEVSMLASDLSSIPGVRTHLLQLQRDMAHECSVVMEGRDIGTVVFPDAEVKVFLTASLERRADRRFEELQGRGVVMDRETLLQDIAQRDAQDESRDVAPMRPACDAILVDTDHLSIDEVVDHLRALCVGVRNDVEHTP